MARRQSFKTGMEPDAAVSAQTLADISARAAQHCLAVLGGFHASNDPSLPKGTQSLLMLGPSDGFWPHFTAGPEWQDGAPDPIDRWSRRVIGLMACDLGAKAVFPFGGPPYHPFYTWALRTGRVWESPTKLLVHDRQGLMVSFRGALALKQRIDVPPPSVMPCTNCPAPCKTACPVGALGSAGYDLPACHSYLGSELNNSCMAEGCAARRACPAGQGYARLAKQSAYHMGQFHR